MWGVFLYTQAIPFVIASNFIYFVNFESMFSKIPAKYLSKYPWMDIKN